MSKTPAFVFREGDRANVALVRQIILHRLKHDSDWHQFDYNWHEANQKVVEFEEGSLRSAFVLFAGEVMWQLIAQGVITPGKNESNPTLPWFRVTAHGRAVIESGRMIPHDPAGYLAEVALAAGPEVGSVSIRYIEEALHCFNAGCHAASVLLLGVASESVFLDLCAAIGAALTIKKEKAAFAKATSLKHRHRLVMEKVGTLPKKVRKDELPESLDITLTSLYDLIRRQRNELGHPQETLPEISREQAFVFFQLFPQFLKDAQAFAAYAEANGL